VAPHAFLVLWGKSRQGVSVFVTNATLFFDRPGQVDLGFSDSGRQRIVRIMTTDAVLQVLARLLCQAAMGSFVDLIQDINVTVFTLLDTEEILEALVDVSGIRMRPLLCNVPMAF
jgi:hypothetical protein